MPYHLKRTGNWSLIVFDCQFQGPYVILSIYPADESQYATFVILVIYAIVYQCYLYTYDEIVCKILTLSNYLYGQNRTG